MDYNKIFEKDKSINFFYTNYPGNKMMVGIISLQNAIARLSKNEYYTLVTYHENDVLPEQYIPLNTLTSDDGTLFATLNPDTRFSDICMNGGIQRVSRLPNSISGSPRYLLGPGPDTILLEDIIMKQYDEYQKTQEQTNSVRNGR